VTAFYNEIDPYAADWLRNLITAGHIAPGVVDTRSIEDIEPHELDRFTQCHFFAGIGVWSHSLRLAGWPDTRPVWTGSCPCQPFSAAGKGAGFSDERHLWPAWFHLVQQCRPAVVFGEQVASKNVEPWIDLVQSDLEAVGYAVGAVAFPSAGVGAPHIRDRCYFVAHAEQHNRGCQASAPDNPGAQTDRSTNWPSGCSGVADLVADAVRSGRSEGRPGAGHRAIAGSSGAAAGSLADDDGDGCGGQQGLRIRGAHVHDADGRGPVGGFWAGADWIACRDEKWRPVEPGTFPLAHGAPARVGRLRAYGNAINSQAARAFVESYLKGELA
jgi:DNA (cytosine-5)-methyltransferase 1